VKHHYADIRISAAEAIVLLELAERLLDEDLCGELNPAEQVVVTNLVDVLAAAVRTSV
jgi:hypothetical protein